MTPAQVAHIMSLVDKYTRVGHSSCTALADMDRLQAHYRKAIKTALRDAPTVVEPIDIEKIKREAYELGYQAGYEYGSNGNLP